MKQDEAFKSWWHNEGSQAPYTHHDCEEHTMRMCEIAWANGAYKEREAAIKIIKETPFSNWFPDDVIETIRARGQA
jgi:predicted DCC family thiol-disulfide oxidoreductase YuxK